MLQTKFEIDIFGVLILQMKQNLICEKYDRAPLLSESDG